MRLRGARIVVAALFSAREQRHAELIADLVARIAAAGGTVVATVVQRRGISRDPRPGGASRMDQPMSRALLGTGKLAELAQRCADGAADAVIFWNRLTPRQRELLAVRCAVTVHDAAALGLASG